MISLAKHFLVFLSFDEVCKTIVMQMLPEGVTVAYQNQSYHRGYSIQNAICFTQSTPYERSSAKKGLAVYLEYNT